MRELEYPFDSEWIIKKKRHIKRNLEAFQTNLLEKRIAVLGGSTTKDVVLILELFLLNYGIKPVFWESEYGQYWQDAMFDNADLVKFKPDIIYIHTTSRNIEKFPEIGDTEAEISQMLENNFSHWAVMWDNLAKCYQCPIIQNNFELPYYRLLGNCDISDIHGRANFISQLNSRLYLYAQGHEGFYINDIQYLSACYGLQKWLDPFYWHMYKYALAVPAIPELVFNIANIIKSIYGKNKKALVLDLDNTLWGGVVGDDGVAGIEMGQETSLGQMFSEFQQYIKNHKDIGVLLNVNSKNEEENALAGLQRPDCILRKEDFICIRANWNSKDQNILEIAKELNIGVDSLVFIDDNPAERHIVKERFPDVATPEIVEPETYINILDRSGFFEVTNLSEDDRIRNQMYKENVKRQQQQRGFRDYQEYLLSLEMEAEIRSFSDLYISRIVQLTNKSNQFNLTTKRYSLKELETISADENYLTLYGKLKDRFGDNGVVSVVLGYIEETFLHLELWLMSCRVMKRDMEYAMMDAVVEECRKRNVAKIRGYYYPTDKNKIVRDFYDMQGYTKVAEDGFGNTIWELDVSEIYTKKNKVIKVV